MPDTVTFEVYKPFGVRDDLVEAHRSVWKNLARPGTWLTAAEKVAVAAETRAATECALCRERKSALSPYAVDGVHDAASDLDPARVDAIHRITTDPGRLSKRLIDDLAAAGTDDAAYVEMLSIALFTMAIDMFHRALGAPLLSLPEPQEGAPSRERPAQVEDIGAWVPVLPARSPILRELMAGAVRISNVARGLSLVPDMVREQLALVQAQYIPISAVASTADVGRAIDRAQIELIAGRVSAVNECFY